MRGRLGRTQWRGARAADGGAPSAQRAAVTCGALAAALACAAFAPTLVRSRGPQQPPQPSAPAAVAEDVTPPPVKRVPESDRAQLAQAKDRKARVKLTFEMAEQRLTRAATLTAAERFEDAADELGVYQALIDDIIKFLQQDGRSGKARDLFKRIELTLRAHMPRIETIRRLTPSEDAVHVKACIEFVREARTRALESFYSDTVLRERPEKKSGDGSAQTTPPRPPEKKPERP
jgi:hypothetical protein